MTVAAEVAILFGAGLTAASVIQQGRIASAQGKAQDKIADFNAKQAKREAQARLDAAHIEADRIARKGRFVMAANRAVAAKSGISIAESPSTIEVLADTAFQFHLDRNLTLMQGMKDYVSLNAQSSLLRAEGAYAKSEGKSAYRMSFLTAGGALLSGYGMAKYYQKPLTSTAKSGTISGTAANRSLHSPSYNFDQSAYD